jgi:hypothetical protein
MKERLYSHHFILPPSAFILFFVDVPPAARVRFESGFARGGDDPRLFKSSEKE